MKTLKKIGKIVFEIPFLLFFLIVIGILALAWFIIFRDWRLALLGILPFPVDGHSQR